MKYLAIIILLFLASLSYGKVLNDGGQTFKVQEEDFRVFIQERLATLKENGQLQSYENEAKKRIAKEVYHPKALALSTQSDTETYTVDPSVKLQKSITDQTGRILVAKGATVNPFKTVHLKEVLIFFNGDDAKEVNWVKANYKKYAWVKFILTGGDIRDAAKLFGRIYFDQKGLITKKLHIHHVPAIAQQDHLKWKITVIGSKNF